MVIILIINDVTWKESLCSKYNLQHSFMFLCNDNFIWRLYISISNFLSLLDYEKKENENNKFRGENNILFIVSLRMQMVPPYWVVSWLIDRYQKVEITKLSDLKKNSGMASTQVNSNLKVNQLKHKLNSFSVQLNST